ncbi:centrosomal protein of 57 kDa-like isoform X16 [Oopsacas minuta]|uniref:Centrosomal protein of 57 kDa-like isoform X16 n=1 Tax=Oopsacas minuta TaxID=111878 RepID=A0AAV7JWH8_9METZ|nr:centrosomal protein of 57 kDa-like isoform X16 [Oopsacas minuta]
METWPEHIDLPSLPSVRSGASTPYKELDLLQDNYYKQFLQGIDKERDRPYSPTNLSIVSASTNISYAQPQGMRDSVFKPIREVLADHQSSETVYSYPSNKHDTTSDSIHSQAMIEALRALQSKIARLETERAAAAEKFESLSSRTSQKQLDLLDRSAVTENVLEHSRIQPVSPQNVNNYEVERRLDSINEKCWQQAQELETTREMLRRAELDRKYTEEQMSRLEHKYDELRTSSEILQPQFQLDTELLAKRDSEEAVRKVEERQREMASSQEQTENKLRELQHELKLERHRRKLLQEKAADLQAGQDANLSLARATALSSCPHSRTRVKKKKIISNKLTKHKHTNTKSRDHYRVQLKDIPFVVGTSTSQSHSVAANYQQLIALLKSHNTAVCGRGSHGPGGKEVSERNRSIGECLPKEDSKKLIEELEKELATLQIHHQHLARELQMSQDSPTKDSAPIEQALSQLLEQMDVKAQHVRLAKTVNKQVNSKRKDSVETIPSHPQTEIPVASNSPPVNLYNLASLPASNITALRTMKNIQNTLKEEDLHWN